MTLSQNQEDKFADWQDVIADLTVSDLEASTWPLIKEWDLAWYAYIKADTAPGSDRPPSKPHTP